MVLYQLIKLCSDASGHQKSLNYCYYNIANTKQPQQQGLYNGNKFNRSLRGENISTKTLAHILESEDFCIFGGILRCTNLICQCRDYDNLDGSMHV